MDTATSRRRNPFRTNQQVVRILLVMSLLVAAGALPAQAAPVAVVELDPSQSNIAFLLAGTLHDAHGTFKLKSGSMRFDPATGEADGSIVVDVTSGDTGNSARDRKMHHDILESYKFGEAIFTPRRVVGRVAAEGASQVDVPGVLRIHGADHDVTMKMSIVASGGKFSAQTRLNIPYQSWGMKNPSTFLLSVAGDVTVEISVVGSLSTLP
jgi:polyisoprenoid-binding protein YceI